MINSWKDSRTDEIKLSIEYNTTNVRCYNRIFYLGDTVSIRSAQGYEEPVLTINKFKVVDDGLEAECVWFDKNSILRKAIVSLATLVIVESNGKAFTKDSS